MMTTTSRNWHLKTKAKPSGKQKESGPSGPLFSFLNRNMNDDVIVYQVRSIDAFGNQGIIHAYATEEEAKTAIAMMKKRTNKRYTYVPVVNLPDQFWGINFPPEEKPKLKRR